MKPAHPEAQPPDTEPFDPHASLSALMDGRSEALASACEHWQAEASARAKWHRYHLIGDALRSEDLVASPERDAAFLAALRARLLTEPVVLAPAALQHPAPARAALRWHVPVAATASLLMVVGAMLVARMAPVPMPGEVEGRASLQAAVRTDPRLDEFLRAHQAAGGGLGTSALGGTLRRVDLVVPAAVQR